jgi:hypothetical protein
MILFYFFHIRKLNDFEYSFVFCQGLSSKKMVKGGRGKEIKKGENWNKVEK